ncbi:hydroxypyruvate isomerase [Paracoccus sediminis]|uniref:Hydroxypyruvate isomerase n=1 Tax=Paracoccus sediminis TaxID=1214787 RepID=A0A238WDS0_9RHOB|nr:TIM barrel protein [Paracoccus sediminis]TBN50969.1 hydroxypyruvate isomerase [Paracoccus sediminis]SNR43819.1 hydroxypyruvate isomerase [Paracoccus sediminis]
MPRFAANLTMLFTEMPMLDRFAAAADAGFQGVEILFPYDIPARDLSRAAVAAGLDFVLMNTPPPNWAGGPRGFAAEPGLEERFRSDFDRALRFAGALRTRHIHVMAGYAQGSEARATFVANLSWAAARAPHVSLTIEPLNPADQPGYFLDDFDLAADLIAQIGVPNIGLQFDAYHAHLITGDAMAAWRRHAGITRHVQIAGVPGRHEPAGGMIDYPAFFAALDQSGYRGWVSAEYNPLGLTAQGLGWLPGGSG